MTNWFAKKTGPEKKDAPQAWTRREEEPQDDPIPDLPRSVQAGVIQT